MQRAVSRLPILVFGLTIALGLAGEAVGQKSGVEIAASFKGHDDGVYTVAFTPDDRFLVTGSFDNTIKLWDLQTGKEFKTYAGANGHTKMVTTVVVSPDGSLLASGSADNQVKLWDVPLNAPVKTHPMPDSVKRLALSPDGTKLAIGSPTGKIVVVNTADYKEIAKFDGKFPLTTIAIPNNQLVIAGGEDGSVRYFGLQKNETTVVGGHRGPVHQAMAHANGQIFSVGADGTLRMWSNTPTPSKSLDPLNVPTVVSAFSIDGQVLALAGNDKNVRLVTPNTKKDAKVLTGATADITSLMVHGALVVAGQADGKWTLWNSADGKISAQAAAHKGKLTALAIHPGGAQLATAGADAVKIWKLPPPKADPKNDPMVAEVPIAGAVSLQWNPQGTQLLIAGGDKTVKLWDIAKKAAVKSYGPLPDAIHSAAFSRDYQLVVAAAGKTVKIWNLADDKEVASLVHPAAVRSFSIKADRTRVLTGCDDKQARYWELPSGKELQYSTFTDPVHAVSVDPNTNQLISVAGKSVHLETPQVQRVITVDNGPTFDWNFGPNPTFLYTVGADKTVKMWNIGSLAQEKTAFAPATAPLRAVAVSKNNLLLASGGDDKIVRIFGVQDGKEIAQATVDAPIRGLVFSQNNQLLIANLADKKFVAFSVNFNPGQPPPNDFMKPAQTFVTQQPVPDLLLLADNATLLLGSAEKRVEQWKVASPNPIKTFPHPALVHAIAFHPKTNTIVTGCHDGKIRFWDPVKNATTKTIDAHIEQKQNQPVPNPIYTVAFSPDATRLLSCSFDRSIKLWDANGGNLVREIKGHNPKDAPNGHFEEIFAATFSPDGKLIASASGGLEKVIKLWKADDGSFVRDLVNPALTKDKAPVQSHPGWILHLRFLKDGRLVSVGDAPKNQGYLAVWQPQDGRLLFSEQTKFGSLFGCAVSPDEKLLAVAAGNRTGSNPQFNQAYLLRVPGVTK
jgi:WD40 repeat protein